jgi:hypothetical protein
MDLTVHLRFNNLNEIPNNYIGGILKMRSKTTINKTDWTVMGEMEKDSTLYTVLLTQTTDSTGERVFVVSCTNSDINFSGLFHSPGNCAYKMVEKGISETDAKNIEILAVRLYDEKKRRKRNDINDATAERDATRKDE